VRLTVSVWYVTSKLHVMALSGVTVVFVQLTFPWRGVRRRQRPALCSTLCHRSSICRRRRRDAARSTYITLSRISASEGNNSVDRKSGHCSVYISVRLRSRMHVHLHGTEIFGEFYFGALGGSPNNIRAQNVSQAKHCSCLFRNSQLTRRDWSDSTVVY